MAPITISRYGRQLASAILYLLYRDKKEQKKLGVDILAVLGGCSAGGGGGGGLKLKPATEPC